MGKIIMPKNSALLEEVEAALKIYYEENDWLSNDEYKARLMKIIGADQDSSAYTKKAQIASYFGFVKWADITNVRSLRRITDAGKTFYEHIVSRNRDAILEDLMRSLEKTSFGRKNYGCPDSDSDVEPPAVFVRSIVELGYLTYKEFAFLLWKLEDCGGNYTDTLREIKRQRSSDSFVLPEEANKYTDAKPIMVLVRWGFLAEDDREVSTPKHIVLSKTVQEKYVARIKNLKIYNIDKDTEEVKQDNVPIEERVLDAYSKMDLSEMESEIEGLYQEFKDKYSPDVLLRISDKELPRYMFLSETNNQSNMCWNLEFNPKLKKYFGAVGGGNAYTYGLHYSQKHNSWMTGPGNKPIKLDENGAIEVAKEIRQKLVDAVSIVKKYEGIDSVAKYAEMHAELEESIGNESNKLWFKKYLHMMFPHMFATFYNYEWLTFLNRKCGFEQHDDLYEISGELSFLANRVELPNSVVAKVLFELFGYPNQEKEEFNDEEENKKMVDRKPRTNKTNPLNSIIYGAPGTGKTYSTAEYAVAFVEGRKPKTNQMSEAERAELMKKYRELTKNGQVVFTTFHQSYGYEDFIQGLRPDTKDGEMRFVPADGVFKKIADKAMQVQEKNYVIIIDEINRGNISKVFGELITLIEEDKRWGENNQLSVMLPSGQEFAVPNNLYIIGTMNSADKSIALIDTALRRRFEFIEVAPNEDLVKDATLKNVLIQLNAVLRKQLESSDLLIGHAYFIGKNKDDLANILNRNIIPLLYEYFYDNEKKVKDALAKAIEGTDVKINETINGRIRVE